MEDKLHGFADSFRRERDDAHRRKLMAQERLNLKKQEAQAARSTVKCLKDKNDELRQQMGKAPEVEKLKKELDRLTKEMTFQHAQLINKRNILEGLSSHEAKQLRKFHASIGNASTQVRTQRSANQDSLESFMSSLQSSILSETCKGEGSERHLLLEVENDRDGRLVELWPRLVQAKIQLIGEQCTKKREETETLQRVIDGYQNRFGLSVDERNLGSVSRDEPTSSEMDTRHEHKT